jgi:hypothetical protein
MARTPKPENLAKLTEEQRKVYDSWVREREMTNVIIEQALDALGRADHETAMEHFHKLDALIPDVCEHGNSIWGTCSDCDSIWETLFPEDFDPQGNLWDPELLYNRSLN